MIDKNKQLRFTDNVLQDIRETRDRFKTMGSEIPRSAPLKFGISYLDDCLGGIWSDDLVVLGAKSGLGKTEAARICAMANARGKRVHFFALEGFENEIEKRAKFSIIAKAVYGPLRNSFPVKNFNFMDWITGKYREELAAFEAEIDALLEDGFPNLKTYYQKRSSLNENNIEKTILSIQDQTDLIIIDHLHYFDFEDENENRAMKKMVKSLKRLSQDCNKPILLLAHMRKTDRRFSTMVPDLDDFHGSSDIVKIATKVVILAPSREDHSEKHLFPTYIRAAKNRYDQSRSRFTGLCLFNARENNYEETYKIGKISFDGQEFKESEEKDVPYWAEHEATRTNAKKISSSQTEHSKNLSRRIPYAND